MSPFVLDRVNVSRVGESQAVVVVGRLGRVSKSIQAVADNLGGSTGCAVQLVTSTTTTGPLTWSLYQGLAEVKG